MYYQVLLAGIWVVLLPFMNWNKDVKNNKILHVFIGVYTCFIAILNLIYDKEISSIWIQVAYFLICPLSILEIIKKCKGQRNSLDTFAIIIAIFELFLSLFLFINDYNSVDASILMIVGALIVLSVPFYRVSDKIAK